MSVMELISHLDSDANRQKPEAQLFHASQYCWGLEEELVLNIIFLFSYREKQKVSQKFLIKLQ